METLKMVPVRVKIAAIIKKAILAGEYKKGEELSLTDLANRLGVSRTPVREAFQALEAEGLIQLRMNKGAIVKGIDRKFVTDHYEMRILLESEAARRAAERGMDVTLLLKELEIASESLSEIDKDYYEDLNLRIHTAIWKAADNQKLYSYLISLWNGPSIGKRTNAREHYRLSTDEHTRMLVAISEGNGEEAAACMKIHIRRSMDNMLESFDEEEAQN